jgi:hypothetical protein
MYLAASLLQGQWLADPSGQPIATDFVNMGRGSSGLGKSAASRRRLHKAAGDRRA